MQYLVTMETVEQGQLISPQQRAQFREQVVLPGYQVMKQLRAEKKVLAGGHLVGRRGVTFIADVATNDQLHQLLESIPWYWTTKNEVTPLRSWELTSGD